VDRLITGIGLGALTLALILWAEPGLFALLLTGFILLTQSEYYDLFKARPEHAKRSLGLVFSAMLSLSFYWGLAVAAATFSVCTLTLLTWILFLERNRERAVHTTAITLFGMVYVTWNLGHLSLIRQLDNGVGAVFLLLFAIWAGDSVAYYVGKRLGRHHIFPAVSPKKTWEGSAAGLLASVGVAMLAAATFYPQVAATRAAGMGLAIGIAGQVGDFFESMLKRSAGIKDSSSLLPGHGGLLDRLDSLTFAAPVFYYLSRF
jgi:phosphatidate cytidylyltransferase